MSSAHRSLVSLFQRPNGTSIAPASTSIPQYGMPVRFNPMIGFALAGLFAICFFTGSLCVYLKRCCLVRRSAATRSPQLPPVAVLNPAQHSEALGLDKESINALPVFAFSPERSSKQGKSTTECSVCLSEFQKREPVKVLPGCTHLFHPDCIDMWLHSHSTCPVCRCILLPITKAYGQPPEVENANSPWQLQTSFVPTEVSIAISEDDEAAGAVDGEPGESDHRHSPASEQGISMSMPVKDDSFEQTMSFVPRVVRAYLHRSKSSPMMVVASAAGDVESHGVQGKKIDRSGGGADVSVEEPLTSLRRATSSTGI